MNQQNSVIICYNRLNYIDSIKKNYTANACNLNNFYNVIPVNEGSKEKDCSKIDQTQVGERRNKAVKHHY